MMNNFFGQEELLENRNAVNAIKESAFPLHSKADLQPLFDRIADARIVMLGEASHGTHEYYTWRTYITKQLIEKKDFNFIAVDGDWPDCYLLNRFIKGYDAENKSTFKVLHAFNRWPTWMWANWEIVALANWLLQHNKALPVNKKVGFYGLDVYSRWGSMQSIMKYLKKTDPAALKAAETAFLCFEPYNKDEDLINTKSCRLVPELYEDKVVDLLKEIHIKLPSYNVDFENSFCAEQNALVTLNAEKYYRAMIKGGAHSWNLRDRHMDLTMERLLKFHGDKSKVIVWEHNTHIGDALATNMVYEGMYNLGELSKIQHVTDDVVLVGFGSYKGTVTAARSWGAPIETMEMPEARKGSWEYLLHNASNENKLLLMNDFINKDQFTKTHIDQRAIGVVYNAQHEHYGNYVASIMPLRYDAFIYLDETHALHPLHIDTNGKQVPETYPFGI